MITLLDTLKELCLISSPSGYEYNIRSFLKKRLERYEQLDIFEDNLGNLFASKKGKGDKKLMIVAHCDEVGFVIKNIDKFGSIRFAPIGGIDINILKGLDVIITHNGKRIKGVIGVRPIHFAKNEKLEKAGTPPLFSELWIDIGAFDKENAESFVSVGDPITFSPSFSCLCNDIIAAKSIDNRAGVATLLAVIDALYQVVTDYNITFVFSTQEEIGLRGAAIAGYKIKPDLCIAIDTTHASDYPNIDTNSFGDIRIACGPTIPIGANFDSAIQNKLIASAHLRKINYQIEAIPGYSGTDIERIQLTRGGIQTGLICIPCRYMHTPVEVASIKDIMSTAAILVEFCTTNKKQ